MAKLGQVYIKLMVEVPQAATMIRNRCMGGNEELLAEFLMMALI